MNSSRSARYITFANMEHPSTFRCTPALPMSETSRMSMPYFFTMRSPVSMSTDFIALPSRSHARFSASTSATKSTLNASSLSLYLMYFRKISSGLKPVLPCKPRMCPFVRESRFSGKKSRRRSTTTTFLFTWRLRLDLELL